jgi:TPR repeat protein
MYYEGLGVKKDYVQSLEWFSQAAAKGHVGAMFAIGMIYGSGGAGVQANSQQAAEWNARAKASKTKD